MSEHTQKHTPGPWHYRGRMITGNEKTVSGETRGKVVCMFGEMWQNKNEIRANARLIAAAHDQHQTLLEELEALRIWQAVFRRGVVVGKDVQDIAEGIDISISKIEAAIAKANLEGDEYRDAILQARREHDTRQKL